MRLDWLGISHFRNYTTQQFEFHPHTNIIHGQNAQGKTNILEAIYLLATLQTFRSIDNRGMISWRQVEAMLEGRFFHGDMEKKLSLLIGQNGKKPQINGELIKKSADYFGKVSVICFTPMDLQILQGGAKLRRRYLDRAIFHLEPLYGVEMGQYNRALMQRNAALKIDDDEWVNLWGEKLHKIGATVLLKRLQFLGKLNTLTSCLYREIAGSDPEVDVRYETDLWSEELQNVDQDLLFSLLQEKQQVVRERERRLRRTLVGPHLDDFSVMVDGKNLRLFGSQGEQRTAILSLKLSEWMLFEREKGLQPIFLLDDIASELDDDRRGHLFKVLQEKEAQIFVTTTDLGSIRAYQRDASEFKIEKGSVVI